jgi:hypothetical protein
MATTTALKWERELIAESIKRSHASRELKLFVYRKKAAELGMRLTAMRADLAVTKYADFNMAFVSDPEIDVLEIRYRAALVLFERFEREMNNGETAD